MFKWCTWFGHTFGLLSHTGDGCIDPMLEYFSTDGVYRCQTCGLLQDHRKDKVPLLPEDLNKSMLRGHGITKGVTDKEGSDRIIKSRQRGD